MSSSSELNIPEGAAYVRCIGCGERTAVVNDPASFVWVHRACKTAGAHFSFQDEAGHPLVCVGVEGERTLWLAPAKVTLSVKRNESVVTR